MERGLALLFPVFLGLLQRAQGGSLEMEPPGSVVAVSVGGSQQLTCRLSCADPRNPRVQWRGLDTSLGTVRSDAHSSVLSVHNASLSEAGTRVCVGSCGTDTLLRTVKLLVFAFPDQLAVSPVALVAGRDQEVACTAHNVTPANPETLSLSLLLGDQELEGVQALDWDVEEEPQQGEDQLLRVTQRWRLPPLETPTPLTLHCRATMDLPGLRLSHQRAIPVLHSLTSPEPPVKTSPEATPELSSTSSSGSPGHPPGNSSSGSPGPPPGNSSSRSPGPRPGNSSILPCHPEIRQSPAAGGLDLLCQALCGPGVAVGWTQAPGGLEAYQRWEAGAQAWLSVPWAGCCAEGWFQCRLDPGGQMASLHLAPEICCWTTPPALWTGSLVLGLLFLAFLAHRLRKRCRPAQ
ncbi:mucosal addressin cell adhesion molecule 1 [Meles meles]|uniref:mucosal addressin cell adhesion molecule 1 n=1 Tax=Meles meles TaxID=9662 RepID=UPI001E69C9CB|nr:mucosal addressin cell adhesion molecule 1 [Meles meles]